VLYKVEVYVSYSWGVNKLVESLKCHCCDKKDETIGYAASSNASSNSSSGWR